MPPPKVSRAKLAPRSRFANLLSLASRHTKALWYVLTVLLPVIIRTGKKPVIFSKYSGIGDIICTLPAAVELKKRHPGHEIIYNCFKDYSCLPRLGGITNHVTNLDAIGVVSYWYGFLLAGFYQFASQDDAAVDHTEMYIKDFANRFGVTVEDSHPRLQMNPVVIDRMKTLLEHHGIDTAKTPIIAIHPGPTLPVREWPGEHWLNLVSRLREKGLTNIIQLGTGKILRFGDVAVSSLSGTVQFLNQLTLEETIAIISISNLFVGVDSGLLHAAVSVGTPSVGLWGATSPRFRYSTVESRSFVVSTVECQGCHHRQPVLHWDTGCPFDIRCMKSITVDEVMQACVAEMSMNEQAVKGFPGRA